MKFRLPGKLILAVGLTLMTALDRYAGRSENLVPGVSPGIAVLGAQSVPRGTGNQPRDSAEQSMDRAPRLVVTSARQQGGDAVAIDDDDIGGVVTGANGPEVQSSSTLPFICPPLPLYIENGCSPFKNWYPVTSLSVVPE